MAFLESRSAPFSQRIVNAQPLGSTVVANGVFPGPLITGNKGDQFQINVEDNLSDTKLDTVTSVVSKVPWERFRYDEHSFSTGTVSSSMAHSMCVQLSFI
jgi:hypothetical protein